MKDCRECHWSIKKGLTYLCTAFGHPKPTSYMRDARSECGLEGALFELRDDDKRYCEADEL
jgi:hypothetical protein